MSKTPIHANLVEERSSNRVVRSLHYDGAEGQRTVRWEISGDLLPSPLHGHEVAAVALVFEAMRSSRPLHIAGPVSRLLLANLADFQAAWSRWRPAYRPVPITTEGTTEPVRMRTEAVSLFSGGVDATYTLWRHHHRGAGEVSRPIASAVLIHGFDIPLTDKDAFDRAASDARMTLAGAGIPLTLVQTDWKTVTCKDWEMEFAAGLAASLWQFSADAGAGLVGSDEDYASLAKSVVLPWGSNPVTTPLLSGDGFEVRYDGAGATRTEKVRALVTGWPAAAERLRVCWEGPSTGRNCGACEKCVRTKLNFLASGLSVPASLGAAPTPAEVKRINARNPVQISYLEDILSTAREGGIDAPWSRALARSVTLKSLMVTARSAAKSLPVTRSVYPVAKSILRKVVRGD